MIEKPNFFPFLTGYENLKLLASLEKSITKERIDEVLQVVGLEQEKNKLYATYSQGMKEKLGIAQAVMEDFDFLILDEPFNSLDVQSVQEIKQYILSLKQPNRIILLTSHIEGDLIALCDEIIKIESGEIHNEIPA